MSIERLGNKSRAALLGIPLSFIALTGCAGSDEPDAQIAPTEAAEKAQEEIEKSPGTKITYFANGTRLIEFVNTPNRADYSPILQVCDGPDLLEQSEQYGQGAPGSDRSVDHKACQDGKLTPEDFELDLPLEDN